jgi:inosine-uridine nucleoside N-ribohydrolase
MGILLALGTILAVTAHALAGDAELAPVSLMFDTDMGNDIDDCLALGVIHALESRGECRLLSVTLSKDNRFAAPFCDLVNTFYGRGDLPIGVVRNGPTPEDSRYLTETVGARAGDGPMFPHDLTSGADAPEAVSVLRQVMAAQPDGSVTVVVVGFSTNLARLLESGPDSHSDLSGKELIEAKCRKLVMMAGMFTAEGRNKEYNVYVDAPAAAKVFAEWPTPVVTSGFEIGRAVKYPAVSIEQDFRYVEHHPLPYAYALYQAMPYDRETWDLTAVLYTVRPDRGYFGLSEPGTISVDAGDVTQFAASPEGRHRFLTLDPAQTVRVHEALVQLASQPPDGTASGR